MPLTDHNSIVAWRGKSLLNGDLIQVALTGLIEPSKNDKTGDMVQSWITRVHGSASLDMGTPRERAVCGDCPLRGRRGEGGKWVEKRICYTTYGVWTLARTLPGLPLVDTMAARTCVARSRKPLRLGAYGDPAAVPLEVWGTLLYGTGKWTGYTHQWQTCPKDFRNIVMASVDREEDQRRAADEGWRTFRITPHGARLLPGEVWCPSKRGVSCVECGLCNGLANNRWRRHVAIEVHGWGTAAFYRRRDERQVHLNLTGSANGV